MKKYTFLLIVLTLIITLLAGCSQARKPVTKTGVYFDTVISITLYENNSSELIDNCFSLAEKYDNLFSKTIEGSDVYRVNNSYMEWIPVDQETYNIINESIKYEDYSDGRFSIMCGALTELWDISGKTSDSNHVSSNEMIPSEENIELAKTLCGKKTIDLDESTHSVRINTNGAKLDLGAIAKGYIADKMKEYLVTSGVTSGIIQLGGNVLLIGENPTKESGLYTIGIQKPFSDDTTSGNDVITAVSEKNTSIVTSGNYQRYFEYNDKIYHHIIDLSTGYPADMQLNSVTIITDSSTAADALSTVCFLLGSEKGVELINSINSNSFDVKAIFIDGNNSIIYDSATK